MASFALQFPVAEVPALAARFTYDGDDAPPRRARRRALEALGQRDAAPYTVDYWMQYVDACRELAGLAGVTMRDLDKALWQYSREAAG